MDATFRGHVLGLKNEFVAGFDVNRIDFTHTNNSLPPGSTTPLPTSSVNPWSVDPGVFLSPIATRPSFNTVTNQYALFAEDRLWLTDQWTLIGGVGRTSRPSTVPISSCPPTVCQIVLGDELAGRNRV